PSPKSPTRPPLRRRRTRRPHPSALADLHAHLMPHEAKRRLEGSERGEGRLRQTQGRQQALPRPVAIQAAGENRPGAGGPFRLFREGERVGAGQDPDAEPARFAEMTGFGPEYRPATLIAQEEV